MLGSKKIVKAFATLLMISCCANSYADDSQYLKRIADDTDAILALINTIIPKFYEYMMGFAMNMQTPDNSPTTGMLQEAMAHYGNFIVGNDSFEHQLVPHINFELFGDPLKADPYYNDVAFGTMLNMPPKPMPASKLNVSAYNFVKNASGFSFNHPSPISAGSWGGSDSDKADYQAYYNTIMPAQTYTSYLLSELYAEQSNHSQLTKTQRNLTSLASSSLWAVQVSQQEMGKVFRELLLFQSQSYLVLLDLVQTQKKLLAAVAMNNALTIAGNRMNENALIRQAQGTGA